MHPVVVSKAVFLQSTASEGLHHQSQKPLVVFLGRSNVGKSSLINYLLGKRQLARVSNTPGRTQQVNTFDVVLKNGEQFLSVLFIDLPGYGFAQLSKQQKADLLRVLDGFWEMPIPEFCLALHLFDVRRDPNQEDEEVAEFLHHKKVHYRLVLTKMDTIVLSKQKPMIKQRQEQFGLSKEQVLLSSSQANDGKEAILSEIWKLFFKPDN